MHHLVARPPEHLDAAGITLRRWRPDDEGVLYAAVSVSLEHLKPWMPWATDGYSRQDTQGFLLGSEQEWDAGVAFNYAVLERAELVGCCGLMNRIGPAGLEIGYWVDVRHTGHGVATRSAAALTAVGLALSGVDRIEIHHDEANAASGAIPRKLGYRVVDRVARDRTAPGEAGSLVIWRLDAADYPASAVDTVLVS